MGLFPVRRYFDRAMEIRPVNRGPQAAVKVEDRGARESVTVACSDRYQDIPGTDTEKQAG